MKKYSLSHAPQGLADLVQSDLDLFTPVKSHLEIHTFDNRDKIISAGGPISYLYLLVKGKAKISMLHEDGSSSIVHFVHPKELIGELTLVGVEDHPKDVISIGQTTCLAVPMTSAKFHLLSENKFLLEMTRYIGSKLLDRTWFNAKQQHYELKHRLADYILKCECDGLFSEKHTETAQYLAVSYRHLLHTIQWFKSEGILHKTSGGYTFDKNALEALASVLK